MILKKLENSRIKKNLSNFKGFDQQLDKSVFESFAIVEIGCSCWKNSINASTNENWISSTAPKIFVTVASP
ncbi:MAG TPA: hypothetical protein VLR29_05010, partial [Flavobacterium sp.]|nr:hypothetical protein [Flavobacterium sp.]